MSEVSVKICMGTMCYVMGGAELRSLIDMLPEDLGQKVSVSYSSCLGMCDKVGEPPYVEVNGKIIGGIDRTTLLQIIKDVLNDVV